MYDIIMCNNLVSPKKPDDSYTSEYAAAKQLTTVHLFDIYSAATIKLPVVESKKLIYHGWMMPPAIYQKFYNRCKEFGYELINSPEQYAACHHFNGWYPAIKDLTPKSIIIELTDIRSMMDKITEFMQANNCGVIIKDYVKSLKHHWHEACFIPQGADMLHIGKVVATFLNLKQEMGDMQGNLVVRQFVNLKQIGVHNKSKMPLTKEFRTFVINGELLPTYKYWDQGSYSGDAPPSSLIEEVVDKIVAGTGSNLFTVDVAQLEDGSWTCIEVGDGQVSAIPEQEDRLKFFTNLLK